MDGSVIPGRNDPCPCGSGKKYKKCHGAAPVIAAGNAAELADQARRAMAQGDHRNALMLALALRKRHPDHPEAIRLCGLAHMALGAWEHARRELDHLLKIITDDPAIYGNLGLVLTQLGRADEAQRYCREALRIDPHLADAHNNLAQALAACGKHAEAVQAYRQAIANNPRSAVFRFNLGALLQSLNGGLAEAEQCYRAALAIDPKFPPALVNLGVICLGRGRLEEAASYLRTAHALDGNNAQVLNNLGIERLQAKDYAAAIERFREAIRIADYRPAHVNLGVALENYGDLPAAIAAYRSALEYDPADRVSFRNLLTLLINSRDIEAAYALVTKTYPDLRHLPSVLAPCVLQVFQKTADLDRLDEIRPLLRAKSETVSLSQDDLLALNYDDSLSEQEIFLLHKAWGKRAAEGVPEVLSIASSSRSGRLRLGYLSPDFRRHPVGFFFRNLIAHHDKSRFEVFCYASMRRGDELTEAIKRHADRFEFVRDIADAALARKIRDDGIDILIDLAGHTEGGRLQALAARPAPVQVMYLGYPNTSGADFIDYWITDVHAHRADDDLRVEKLLRLPESFLCFGGFDERPLQGVPPAARNGCVTFGSFNNLAKLSRTTLELWTQVLRSVAKSRLMIKARGASSDIVRANVVEQFRRAGIDKERLLFSDHVADSARHLDCYNEVDIALDCIPYNGTTTTCEALWMGVPVITLVGNPHRQRTSYSILKNIGVEETIAHSAEEFVAIASRLAGDLGMLADMRARTAAQIRHSLLCDAPRFARQFEDVLAGTVGNT